MNYGRELADRALNKRKSIQLKPDEPFTWASGFQMPMYNDNRKHLSSYDDRQLITAAFAQKIKDKGLKYGAIAGTSTAGIAPAASLAQHLKVPLVILHEGKPYFIEGFDQSTQNQYDAIASTCPWGIPVGVAVANNAGFPFMYVREKSKGHGLKQQIEGIPIEGQKVLFVDNPKLDAMDYRQRAMKALGEEGVHVGGFLVDSESSPTITQRSVDGLDLILIEDLVSTGGSSVKEAHGLRELGADLSHCFSIFNYGFDAATDMFAGNVPFDKKAGTTLAQPCRQESILTYDTLMQVAEESGNFSEGDIIMLKDWRQDPFGWGTKHGFPKVDKK